MFNKLRNKFNTPMILLALSLVVFWGINISVSIKFGFYYAILAGIFSMFVTMILVYEEINKCAKIIIKSKNEKE